MTKYFQRFVIFLLLVFGLAASGHAQSLCRATYTLLNADQTPRADIPVEVVRFEAGGYGSSSKRMIVGRTNASGVLIGNDGSAGIPLIQGATYWIAAPFSPFDINANTGTKVQIPNETTWTLVDLPRVGAVLTTIGALPYAGPYGVLTQLLGNTTTSGKVLMSVGDGTNARAPKWFTLSGDASTNVTLTPNYAAATMSIAVSPTFASLPALTASRVLVSDGSGVITTASVTATEAGYLSGVTSAIQTQLNNKQGLDSTLTALAGVTTAADKLIYATGNDTFSTTDFSAFGRTLLDDADASTARATLGVTIGTSVQAYNADLAAITALTPTNDDILQRKAGVWTNRTIAQVKSDFGLATVATSGSASDLSTGTLPDARFPATLPAASGANLTNLNASNLASGTVPLARLSGITNTQVSASAAIAYSKLNLAGAILNADLAGSIDLTTKVTGTLPVANGGTGITALGTGVATALGVNTGSSGAFVVNGGALGTPSSGVGSNLTSLNASNITSGSLDLARIAQGGATSSQVLAWNGSAWAPSSAGAGMSIGGTVTSGTAGRVLYVGAGPFLADSANFTFDGTNVGIGGATPASAFLELPNALSKSAIHAGAFGLQGASADNGFLTVNNYYNSAFTYRQNGFASVMQFISGGMKVFTAPSGTAGATATMTNRLELTNAGLLGIGVTPDSALHLTGAISLTATSANAIKLGNNSNNPTMQLETTAGGGSRWLVDNSSGSLRFVYNAASVFGTFSSAGLFGVNSSTPAAQLDVRPVSSSTIGQVIRLASGQTANALNVENSTGTFLSGFLASGALRVVSLADADAPTNSIYYSTTASKLVFKDAGGTVNTLY